MKKSLYNSLSGRVFVFIRRFGISQLFMKPLRLIFAPFILRFKKRTYFYFRGQELACFYHNYNTTWANERQVEIPVVLSYLKEQKGRILEIGRVTPHYFKTQWTVLDKFEKGERVINEDILTFSPKKKYDFIFSISTFEHIGFDDGSEEVSLNKEIIKKAGLKENLDIFIFSENVKKSAAIIKKSKLAISGDTIVGHIAAAVETPVICLFGPTSWQNTAPYTNKRVILSKRPESVRPYIHGRKGITWEQAKYMKDISVDEVLRAAKRIIKNKNC
jgi:hypothetical protein